MALGDCNRGILLKSPFHPVAQEFGPSACHLRAGLLHNGFSRWLSHPARHQGHPHVGDRRGGTHSLNGELMVNDFFNY